jgi:serine/threonine protein kinase/Tol biopolymer transport system component
VTPDIRTIERIGNYRITASLGRGGMGEVYRAHDERLGRDVAIKVLPAVFTSDGERLARFEREARVLASLNHPNIATIHGVERVATPSDAGSGAIHALVLELVDGETLDDRLRHVRGGAGLPLPEILAISRQIADALDAAHDKGIVHRDLKPANIKIRPDGVVKVLDFGLAKSGETAAARGGGALTESPTITVGDTSRGVILGTAPYMSPEQARGHSVDKRADIWAFGCVLYEMLTGRMAFAGATVSDTIAAILSRDVDWSALPATTPAEMRRLLSRCLTKDVTRRLRDIADARLEIEEALATRSSEPVASAVGGTGARVPWRERGAWAVAAVALVAAAALAAVLVGRSAPRPVLTRLLVETPPTSALSSSFALSPDGRQLVFVATDSGRSRLWLRPLAQFTAQPLAGTEGASYPFWSPDSGSVGFFAEGALNRIDLVTGTIRNLAPAPAGRGGTWSRDNVIVFAPSNTGELLRVPASGGTPAPATRITPGQSSHRWPQFLPDGKRFIFLMPMGQEGQRGVYLASLDGGDPIRLIAGTTSAEFAPPGYLLRVVQGTLVAHHFDVNRGMVSEQSVPIEQSVGGDDGAFRSIFSVSESGVLAHRSGTAARRQFVWLDRDGAEIGTLGPVDEGLISSPEIAPDGQRVAITRQSSPGNPDIWLVDVGREVLDRFTTDPADNAGPVWSPHGDRLAFSSGRNGRPDLIEGLTANKTDRPLLVDDRDKAAQDWSPDGMVLLYTARDPKTGSDLWTLSLTDSKTSPIVQSSFDEGQGQFSPDGHWIAYVSNETQRHEVYVRPFPGEGAVRISNGGGIYPRWRADGRELFYVAPDMSVMGVPFQVPSGSRTPVPGAAVARFSSRMATSGPYIFTAGFLARPQYDVMKDGRFLMNVPVADAVTPPIAIVQNWTLGLSAP